MEASDVKGADVVGIRAIEKQKGQRLGPCPSRSVVKAGQRRATRGIVSGGLAVQ
jgi:hypothetical protein